MKLTTILLLAMTMQVTAKSIAQEVTYAGTSVSLQKVFVAIKQQTGYVFFYDKKDLKDATPVTVNFRKVSLQTAMENLLTGQPLEFDIQGNTIVITKKIPFSKQVPELLSETNPPPITVTGVVSDSTGAPLAGVSVLVKGTNNGATSDQSGKFSLSNVAEDAILVFSSVGLNTLEIAVHGKTTITVVLKAKENQLEQIVVIGYGSQKKVNLTGAVATVQGDELVNKPVTGTVDALQGMVPGMVVTKTNGSPGQENYNIQIRGVTSATNNPVLVLIDGIEGNINDVRPEDVQSISVLKDAASAAIYGAKAAGGVVMLTTKSGKSGKTKIEFNSYYTLARLGRTENRIPSYRAALMRNEAEINAGGSAPLSDENLAKLKDPNFLWEPNPSSPNEYRYWGDYDYEKLVLKTFTPMTSNSVAISGGTGKTTFRISGTYFRNNGSLKIGPDNDTKYSARLNLNTQINKYLELSNIVSFSSDQIEKPIQDMDGDYGLWSGIFTAPGLTPLYDPHGHYAYGARVGAFDARNDFPKYSFDAGKKSYSQNNLRAMSTLTIKNVVRNLQFRVVGGIDANFNRTFFRSKAVDYYGIDGSPLNPVTGTNVSKGSANSTLKEFQFLTDYNFHVGNHQVALLGGYSIQDYRYNTFNGTVYDLVNEDVPSFNWASLQYVFLNDDATSYRFQSVFGRLQYNYKDRYLFETNLRYDGSSKLSPDNRYGLFPSVSAGWRISKENWFNLDFLNELKLRGSFGQLGNAAALGNYDYMPLLTARTDLILGSSGGAEQRAQYIYQSQLASRSITWETVQSSNIGLELALLGNRLTIDADIYTKKNKNMLAAVAYPSVLGIGVGNQNAGELKTSGWEINIGWRGKTGNLVYWANLNVDDSRNKLVKYLGATVIAPGNIRLLEGYPINSIFGYKTDGLFQSDEEVSKHAFQNNITAPGDVIYRDLNGDNKITSGSQTEANHGDVVYMGNSNPRYNFGLRGGLSFKGFDFSIFLQGVGKRTFMLQQLIIMPFSWPWFGPQEHNLDYWTPENRDAYWPRLMVSGYHNYLPSDKWIQDAAYIRLKDLQIGYKIAPRVFSRAGITNLRFYVAGRDLWEITKTMKFIDPELPDQSTYQYPFRRSYTVGINLGF